jgi:hypothetical protein
VYVSFGIAGTAQTVSKFIKGRKNQHRKIDFQKWFLTLTEEGVLPHHLNSLPPQTPASGESTTRAKTYPTATPIQLDLEPETPSSPLPEERNHSNPSTPPKTAQKKAKTSKEQDSRDASTRQTTWGDKEVNFALSSSLSKAFLEPYDYWLDSVRVARFTESSDTLNLYLNAGDLRTYCLAFAYSRRPPSQSAFPTRYLIGMVDKSLEKEAIQLTKKVGGNEELPDPDLVWFSAALVEDFYRRFMTCEGWAPIATLLGVDHSPPPLWRTSNRTSDVTSCRHEPNRIGLASLDAQSDVFGTPPPKSQACELAEEKVKLFLSDPEVVAPLVRMILIGEEGFAAEIKRSFLHYLSVQAISAKTYFVTVTKLALTLSKRSVAKLIEASSCLGDIFVPAAGVREKAFFFDYLDPNILKPFIPLELDIEPAVQHMELVYTPL